MCSSDLHNTGGSTVSALCYTVSEERRQDGRLWNRQGTTVFHCGGMAVPLALIKLIQSCFGLWLGLVWPGACYHGERAEVGTAGPAVTSPLALALALVLALAFHKPKMPLLTEQGALCSTELKEFCLSLLQHACSINRKLLC